MDLRVPLIAECATYRNKEPTDLSYSLKGGGIGRGGTSDTVKHPREGVAPVFSATQEEITRELHGPCVSKPPLGQIERVSSLVGAAT